MASAFDRARRGSLMPDACAGCAALQDLAAVGNQPAQARNVFIINMGNFIYTERTDLSAEYAAASAAFSTFTAAATFRSFASISVAAATR